MWRIWYEDGTTADSLTFAPDEVQKTGVAYIQQHTPHGVEPVQGETYYTWDGDRWTGRDEAGFWQYMMRPGPRIVLFGYEQHREDWYKIVEQATNDPDFGTVRRHV